MIIANLVETIVLFFFFFSDKYLLNINFEFISRVTILPNFSFQTYCWQMFAKVQNK